MTELVFILDRSGSMQGMESDTIGGFNSMLKKQKNEEGETVVTTAFFNNGYKIIHDRVPLQDVSELTEQDYTAYGSTALLDAVGGMIRHISKIHKYARKEDVPEKTLFVITTDGYENASRHYSYQQVQQMIEHEKEKYGWEFLFLGANMDAIHVANKIGIKADRAVDYKCDKQGTARNFDVLSSVFSDVRQGKEIAKNWKKPIEDDVKHRGK